MEDILLQLLDTKKELIEQKERLKKQIEKCAKPSLQYTIAATKIGSIRSALFGVNRAIDNIKNITNL